MNIILHSSDISLFSKKLNADILQIKKSLENSQNLKEDKDIITI